MMAEFVNSRLKDDNLHDWDQANAKTRFESYMRSYKAANAWDGSNSSGQGLTSKDIMNGILESLLRVPLQKRDRNTYDCGKVRELMLWIRTNEKPVWIAAKH